MASLARVTGDEIAYDSKRKISREARQSNNSSRRCIGRTETPLFTFEFSFSSTWRPFLLTFLAAPFGPPFITTALLREGRVFLCRS